MRAAAIALREKRIAFHLNLIKLRDAAQDKLKDGCLKFAKRNISKLELQSLSVYDYGNGSVQIEHRIKSDVPEVAPLFKAYFEAKKNCDFNRPGSEQEVYDELRGAADTDTVVAGLLADPKVKAGLLAAAEKLLSTPTKADKLNAIQA